MKDVKEYAQWVITMIKTPVKNRREWVKNILANLSKPEIYAKKINPASARDLVPAQQMKSVAEMLSDKATFELVGFSANLQYVKHDKRNGDVDDDLSCIFVHPWGSPKLLFKHKKLPVIIIVGEDLKLDESVLDENEKNPRFELRGFTG